MGLDVNVYRIIKPIGQKEPLRVHSLPPEIAELFKDFVYTKTVEETLAAGEEHINMRKMVIDYGYDPEKYLWNLLEVCDPKGDVVAYELILVNSETREKEPSVVLSSYEVDEKYTEVYESDFTYTHSFLALDYEDIGWQRKGANRKFYEDGLWGSAVYTKDELIRHWNEYFSSADTYGPCEAWVARQRFKENIVDKFIEGETIVDYN